MGAFQGLMTLLVTLLASFGVGLFLQWLTLHALFHALPGRRRVTVAQVAVMRTRRIYLAPPAAKGDSRL